MYVLCHATGLWPIVDQSAASLEEDLTTTTIISTAKMDSASEENLSVSFAVESLAFGTSMLES